MGDELDIVNAARVSFHKESEWEQPVVVYDVALPDGEHPGPEPHLSDPDWKLLRFLLKNKHGTPFEQGFQSMWHIRLPIFVMREWNRHRIGHSTNEESGRYVEMRPDFYYPERGRTQVGKPGSYSFESLGDEFDDRMMRAAMKKANKAAWDAYQELLAKGHAKEQARIVLPLNLYTEIRWTANARSLMNFLELRNDKDAQMEIRLYAAALETEFTKHMPIVHQAFVEAGRVAP